MNTLRWILAALVALLAGRYLVFFILAGGVRRSFEASENSALLIVVPLLVAGGLVWWIVPWPKAQPARLAPGALAYPVLLVNEDKIAEVCLGADELTQRPENTDHVIEQRFSVVDGGGRRYRIVNVRPVDPRPSTVSRVDRCA